ncbi:hypothetical protein M409DRAFT_52876 [Zasmidium cellare ATCC 36951]|uniref:Alpha-galactosidase A n=1 Tax=Zasmidium cellare ATCC 36951 TaxID=1080233 RepID=A0A6A6CQC3_ZASCE|nr:uncharacterized protein M409DRAFT_52876 [Zasmidium cellare ATCC 36951]KAF2168883.1 hypothetical protein M409DRAFT_52876 [Zasmidium cellare ATCC 36951]
MPRILSMEVDPENETESEYRIESEGNVKYIIVEPGALHTDHLSLPLNHIPVLPYNDTSWTVANISRDSQSRELKAQLSGRKLAGVENVWHNNSFDVLTLQRTKQLSTATFETLLPGPLRTLDTTASSSLRVQVEAIAKIAHFEWEIPRIERETRIYQILNQRKAEDLAPRFLGHIHENGRTMGFLLEKMQGRTCASIEDLRDCEAILRKFHELGLIHGDVNRFNFLVGGKDSGVRLIDFEESKEVVYDDDREQRQLAELHSLRAELMEDSGRGGGFRPA